MDNAYTIRVSIRRPDGVEVTKSHVITEKELSSTRMTPKHVAGMHLDEMAVMVLDVVWPARPHSSLSGGW